MSSFSFRLSSCQTRYLLSLGWLHCTFFLNAADFTKEIQPLLSEYCYDCHADGAAKGDFAMDDHDSVTDLVSDLRHWVPIWENLRSHLMPPANKPQPSDAQRALLAKWIEQEVFKLDHENPDPGRVTIRRLNREEYRHTIADLLDVDFDVEEAMQSRTMSCFVRPHNQ